MTSLFPRLNRCLAAIYPFLNPPPNQAIHARDNPRHENDRADPEKMKPAVINGGLGTNRARHLNATHHLLLPRALFVPIGLKALPALVLRHFQPAFLFEITHGISV